jgi:hypothetical protein
MPTISPALHILCSHLLPMLFFGQLALAYSNTIRTARHVLHRHGYTRPVYLGIFVAAYTAGWVVVSHCGPQATMLYRLAIDGALRRLAS